ncbi:MAG: N-acetyl-gamma-glutamyl-phosphate reductase [Bacillota bacterium]|nr:N-acetyl-gamma-glutamyl-phosphate reductase [Bacillota bacterium]
MTKVGIIGSTGYAGQQLLWLLSRHPEAEIVFLSSHNYSDKMYNSVYESYLEIRRDVCIDNKYAEELLPEIDVLFLAMPAGESFKIVRKALSLGVRVIDIGSDYRLDSADDYESWYGIKHEYSDILSEAVYGMPELNREKIRKASIIANPGCFPTAAILGLAPLVKSGIINTSSIIIDAKSGVSGAGRSASIGNIFTEVNENFKAYKVGNHRHTPEIEQELSKLAGFKFNLTFTPHLVPMNRGILSTIYGNLKNQVSEDEDEIFNIYKEFYKDEPFIRIKKDMPETRWVKGSNFCDISFKIDKRTSRIIVISAIDNLMKGAAGTAVHNMNLMFGFDEKTGIDMIPIFP